MCTAPGMAQPTRPPASTLRGGVPSLREFDFQVRGVSEVSRWLRRCTTKNSLTDRIQESNYRRYTGNRGDDTPQRRQTGLPSGCPQPFAYFFRSIFGLLLEK